jgi:hypothetical protein
MLRALLLAVTILGVPSGPAPADEPPDPGANAALEYWQAFATLPAFPDDVQNRLNAECLTMPLNGQARDMVAKADYALDKMRRGAALRDCDWGIDCGEGIYVRLPQGPAARVLSALACLRARIRFEEGRNAEALDDIVAAMTLGRHLSREGGLIVVLLGYQVEQRMIDVLAAYLPKLDAGTVKALKTRLDALPPYTSQAAMLRECEEKTLDWFIRKVKEAKGREGLLDLLGFVGASEGEGRDPAGVARAFLDQCGGTAEGVIRLAEEVRPCYELMAKKIELPPDQFEKEFARESTKRSGNPVFKVFFPALPKCRRAQARVDVRRALLSAAFDAQAAGRDALKDHPDPIAGGPLEYTAFAGGFELRSRYKPDDQPLTLTVGRRGK